jgi:hypothetical protein
MLIAHELIGDARILNALRQRNQQSQPKVHENLLNRGVDNGDSGNELNYHDDGLWNKIFLCTVNCIILMKRLSSEWVMR